MVRKCWIERFAEVIEEEGEASRMVAGQSGQVKAQLKQAENPTWCRLGMPGSEPLRGDSNLEGVGVVPCRGRGAQVKCSQAGCSLNVEESDNSYHPA